MRNKKDRFVFQIMVSKYQRRKWHCAVDHDSRSNKATENSIGQGFWTDLEPEAKEFRA